MDKNQRIVIVGAGVFGLGAALRFKEEGYTSVTVLDRSMPPVTDGLSNDITRIFRFDYGDAIYAEIAKEAYDWWKTPEFNDASQEYSTKTKRVLTDMGQPWQVVTSVEAAKERIPELTGRLATPGCDGLYNTNAGWADAGKAIAHLAARCNYAGVSFMTGPNGHVTDFEKSADYSIKYVRTADGNKVEDDKFIVATGAWTPSLVPAWNSMLAAGQIVGYLRHTPEEAVQLKKMPIYFNFSTGFFCFPPHDGTDYLKVVVHGFGYTRNNEKANVSSPPTHSVAARAIFVPSVGWKRMEAGLQDLFPHLASRGFERTEICWYNDTPTGDFILDYHSEHKNLFIATGGSGHAFKFLPVIEKYIVGSFELKLSQKSSR